MLLARKGHKVLLVDRDAFPSDKMSTHYIHIPGVARLARWGLYDQVMETDIEPISSMTLHLGDVAFQPPRPPLPAGTPDLPICPRRTVLDKILVDAAVDSGAELRESFSIQELIFDGDTAIGVRARQNGATIEEKTRVVIGADGLHSRVAREVQAPEYNTRETLSFGYYTYWSGLETDGAHIYIDPEEMNGMLIFPTNDGKTCVAAGGPVERFHEFRRDIETNYLKIVTKVDALRDQLPNLEREPFIGTADQPNFFRKPYGPGWALVGDAGYHRDFLTGLGITDAFRDAEFLVDALDQIFSRGRPRADAMADYERRRNEIAEPLYEVTIQMASGEQLDAASFMRFGAAMIAMLPQELPA
jgi:flavin-dependent dehydrogenase